MSKYDGKFTGISLDRDHLHLEFKAHAKDFHKLLDRCYDLCDGVQLVGNELRFKFDCEVVKE